MARRVKLHMREGIAMVTLAAAEGGPSKAGVFDLAAGFDGATRSALAGALDVALTDVGVRAIVLRSGPEGWPRAPRDPAADYRPVENVPDLKDIAARIAGSKKPVIAALSGRITGGALAISQAAGWRLAAPDTVFAALEPGLGYLPGGGGLVEIARRLGAAPALDFVLSGRNWTAQEAAAIGLIDGTVEGSADGAVVALAQVLASGKPAPHKRAADAGLTDAGGYLAAVSAARTQAVAWHAAGIPARVAHRIIDVVEAGLLLPASELNDFEAVALADLIDAPLAKALRYQAAALSRAARLAGARGPAAAGFDRAAIWHCGGDGAAAAIGSGLDAGNGLAISALGRLAGRLAEHGSVRLGAASETDLEEVFAVVARRHAAGVEAGTTTQAATETAWARIVPCVQEADLSGAEASPEWAVVSPPSRGAAGIMQLARVAEGLAGGALGEALPKFLLDTGRAAAVDGQADAARGSVDVGWNLAAWGVIRLGARIAELALPTGAKADHAQPVAAALRVAGLIAVRGGNEPGGIAVRMQAALLLAAERLAIAGADPAQIDRVLESAGFGEGPFRRLDRAGTAATLSLLRRAGRAPGVLIAEWTGGFYASGSGPKPAEGLTAALQVLREGRAARRPSDGQVIARVVAELAGEGAALLQSGGAHRPSDIDLVMAMECGMRFEVGGPMHMADGIGLLTIRNQLRALMKEGARTPVTLWDILVKNGRKFADLDER